MPFFKDLRRRSKASFKTDKSSEGSADGSNGTTNSSSTVNSVYGTSTPASSILPTGSSSNLSAVKPNGNAVTTPPLLRPSPLTPSPLTPQSPNKRYSMTVCGLPRIRAWPSENNLERKLLIDVPLGFEYRSLHQWWLELENPSLPICSARSIHLRKFMGMDDKQV